MCKPEAPKEKVSDQVNIQIPEVNIPEESMFNEYLCLREIFGDIPTLREMFLKHD
jgi:hypothetical protein